MSAAPRTLPLALEDPNISLELPPAPRPIVLTETGNEIAGPLYTLATEVPAAPPCQAPLPCSLPDETPVVLKNEIATKDADTNKKTSTNISTGTNTRIATTMTTTATTASSSLRSIVSSNLEEMVIRATALVANEIRGGTWSLFAPSMVDEIVGEEGNDSIGRVKNTEVTVGNVEVIIRDLEDDRDNDRLAPPSPKTKAERVDATDPGGGEGTFSVPLSMENTPGTQKGYSHAKRKGRHRFEVVHEQPWEEEQKRDQEDIPKARVTERGAFESSSSSSDDMSERHQDLIKNYQRFHSTSQGGEGQLGRPKDISRDMPLDIPVQRHDLTRDRPDAEAFSDGAPSQLSSALKADSFHAENSVFPAPPCNKRIRYLDPQEVLVRTRCHDLRDRAALNMVATAVEAFGREVIFPSLLSHGADEAVCGRRPLVAAFVFLREMVAQNADIIFYEEGRRRKGQEALSEKERNESEEFKNIMLATALVLGAVSRLRNPDLTTEVIHTVNDYDNADGDFLRATYGLLGAGTGPDAKIGHIPWRLGVTPDGKTLGREESLVFACSFRRAMENHPLFGRTYGGGAGIGGTKLEVEWTGRVPEANVCSVFFVEKIHSIDEPEGQVCPS
uniref:Uncharacterized protein n=1 Tax=Corethron hystrix TaxID=216773 RepID=A0A7S1BAC6_9STRA|mmetsp:Transcript_19322/g.44031  ORF Transcript_19322/g.44031 Transcript_19322/m.44031 type:complete len:616 (+) Transcript_19322:149-1996(+)